MRTTGIPSRKARNGPRAGLAVACTAAAFLLGAAGATVATAATPNRHGTSRDDATVSPHARPRAKAGHEHSRRGARAGHHARTRAPSGRPRRKREGALPVQQGSAPASGGQGSEERAEEAAERNLEAEERAQEAAEEAAEEMAAEGAG